jgi:hypothetical protein
MDERSRHFDDAAALILDLNRHAGKTGRAGSQNDVTTGP